MYNVFKTEMVELGRFQIVLDTIEQDGDKHPYSYINMKDGVCVVVMVDEKILLLQEYRHAIRKDCFEFPSGIIDEGETPKDAAIREVREETGFLVDEIVELGYTYPSFGSTTEKIHLFFARCKQRVDRKLDNLEKISCHFESIEDIDKMIEEDELVCGAATTAWLKWKIYISKKEKNSWV